MELSPFRESINAITVFDATGKAVLKQNFSTTDQLSLDIRKLENGVYMVKVYNNSGSSSTIKILKN